MRIGIVEHRWTARAYDEALFSIVCSVHKWALGIVVHTWGLRVILVAWHVCLHWKGER